MPSNVNVLICYTTGAPGDQRAYAWRADYFRVGGREEIALARCEVGGPFIDFTTIEARGGGLAARGMLLSGMADTFAQFSPGIRHGAPAMKMAREIMRQIEEQIA